MQTPARAAPGPALVAVLPALLLAALLTATTASAVASPALRSADGQHGLRADAQALTLEDADGQPLKQWPLRDRAGAPVQVQALAHHARRQAFVVALAGAPELWLIGLDPQAPPIFNGWVHDYRMAEGIAEPGHLGLQRVRLARPYNALWVDARVPWLLGQAGPPQAPQAVVLHLDIRREIAWLPLHGLLAEARLLPADPPETWQLALPGQGGAWVHDTRRWRGRRADPPPTPS